MSESEILAKCAKTFPGIEKEHQFGIDALRASLKLSEKPTQLELGAATQAAQELMDDFKITGVNSVTKLAMTARTCSEKIAADNKAKSDEKFANDIANNIDNLMADGVLKNGRSKFTPVLEVNEKPRFNGHPQVRPNADWSHGYLNKREEKVIETLKKLPNVDVHVFELEQPGGGRSSSINIVPKFYIGVRPKS